MGEPIRVGFLYPGTRTADSAQLSQAVDDYPLAESLIRPPARMTVAITRVAEDAHRKDALLLTGDTEPLREGAAVLKATGVDSVMWACTSGSFVFGLAGATEQAQMLADFVGVPASSTSLAFVAACQRLGTLRVSIAASYPDDVVDLLEVFLTESGLEVVKRTGAGIMTGVEVGTLDRDAIVAMVRAADHAAAEAILVPDTAMHSIGFLADLEAAVAKPVLTANQVSIWQALVLAGHPAAQEGLGSLFHSGLSAVTS